MFDYDAIKLGVAEPLLKQFGRSAVIVRRTKSGADYNPTFTDTNYSIIFMPTSNERTNRNSSVVQVGDILGLVSTETGVVIDKNTDKLKLDGSVYDIIDVNKLNYNGTTTLLYKIHARK